MAIMSCARDELAYFFNEHKFPFYLPFSIRFNAGIYRSFACSPPSIHLSSQPYVRATVIRHRFDLYIQQRYESHLKYHTSLTLCVHSACGMFVWPRGQDGNFSNFRFVCVSVFGHFYYHLNRFDRFQPEQQKKKRNTQQQQQQFSTWMD